MKLLFTEQGWDDYLHWRQMDRRLLKRLNTLIREASRTPFSGTGKPEPLRGALSGYWSRRLTAEHRLVYKATDDALVIVQCRYHY